MKALLIIGMQVDLLPGGPAEVPDSQELVPVINVLMPQYGLVVAANFSLPADHVMFAANHLWRKPGQLIQVDGQPVLLHNIHCVPGSFGAEPIPRLHAGPIRFTALMGTDKSLLPHSAFFDFGKKRDTGMAAFLASHNVEELDIAGMPLETTVQDTLSAAAELGFKPRLLEAACKGRAIPKAV
ncbi:MAG: isochorismatase family protein [Saprospiraceae bacterium]|jgi:nicotinamidase/pyrazinamidase|nr:isochorismatase family protein [Saprospiraceae bacterium]